MDEVFRALADPTRRSLLDELFKADGQTLMTFVGSLTASDAKTFTMKLKEPTGLVSQTRSWPRHSVCGPTVPRPSACGYGQSE